MSAIGSNGTRLPFWVCAALLCSGGIASGKELGMHFSVDPISRLIHVGYRVPEESPDELTVRCSWARRAGGQDWRAARVQPLISQTAWAILHYTTDPAARLPRMGTT